MSPFRVLYRLFLFRLVDVELLAANARGDSNKLLGQIAALLIFISIAFAWMAGAMTGDYSAPMLKLVKSWNAEHQFLATALLIATVLAVLSWDGLFPDRRDVMTLSPLPLSAATIFLAKMAALASAVGVLTAAFCAFPIFCYSVTLAPAAKLGIFDIGTWAGAARTFLAFSAVIAAACLFPISVVALFQGVGAAVLPRNLFLRISGVLQIALFALAVLLYFAAPPIPANLLGGDGWIPSQWLLGMFESMRGPLSPALIPFARRGWGCFIVLVPVACISYAASYLMVTRQIVEQPDITPSRRVPRFSLRFGGLVETAIVVFSVRTLVRSKQHRVVLALYLGLAMAIVISATRTPVAVQLAGSSSSVVGLPGLIASTVTAILGILGMRVVFALPHELRANWVFQTAPIPAAAVASRAVRRALLMMAAAPVVFASTAVTLHLWPIGPAAAHAAVLSVLTLVLMELGLWRFDKLPFTCSYLPGKSNFNIAFLGFAMLLETVVIQFAAWERGVLGDMETVAKLVLGLAATWCVLYWQIRARASSCEVLIQFEQDEDPEIAGLGLFRDGVLPQQARQ